MINGTQTLPARQHVAVRVHPAWCMAPGHDGDCTWIAGYVPAVEGDLLVTVRQAGGYDAYVQLTTATATVTLSWSAAEALMPLLRDAAFESTN